MSSRGSTSFTFETKYHAFILTFIYHCESASNRNANCFLQFHDSFILYFVAGKVTLFWYHVLCYRSAAKVPMNMLGRSVQESNQNQSSVGTHSPPLLLSAGTSGESVAPSSSLDLDFLIGKAAKTQSSEKTGRPGGGGDSGGGGGGGGSSGGSDSRSGLGRSSALSDFINGMFINL
jgi:uncharacterized membrane protein YgcG